MNILNFVLLQCNPASGGATGSGSSATSTIIMMVLIAVIFYFFFIRPQSKKNKEMKKFRENLKKGDKVITSGGIHGKIIETNETTVIIETEGQGKLKVEKMSIVSSVAGDAN